MARTANINVRTEPDTKGGFPFTVRQPRYNQETEAAMLEAKDIMSGKQDARRYSSAKELFDELDVEAE